ncbi:chemotaxis protein CheD [Massilia sp. W12]|uniref:chemotaxis protein CheD n=1 Tax=Massilia sp. W12 TaxID=3126507 RepID=UPI0030CA6A90
MPTLYDDNGSYDKSGMGLDEDAIEVFLDPGEYFVGDDAFQVRTLLGSCVSITLWHPQRRFGAMCHFLLSTRPAQALEMDRRKSNRPANDRRSPTALDGKYADEVMQLMINELRDNRIDARDCQAKVFGGGNMFPQRRMEDNLNVGKKNGETAKMLLRSHGIQIVSEDLYGNGHREVIFNLKNGDVWIRLAKNSAVA